MPAGRIGPRAPRVPVAVVMNRRVWLLPPERGRISASSWPSKGWSEGAGRAHLLVARVVKRLDQLHSVLLSSRTGPTIAGRRQEMT